MYVSSGGFNWSFDGVGSEREAMRLLYTDDKMNEPVVAEQWDVYCVCVCVQVDGEERREEERPSVEQMSHECLAN